MPMTQFGHYRLILWSFGSFHELTAAQPVLFRLFPLFSWKLPALPKVNSQLGTLTIQQSTADFPMPRLFLCEEFAAWKYHKAVPATVAAV